MFHDIHQGSFSGKCKKSRQLRTVSHQRKSWCDEKGQEQKRQKGVICYERMLWFCGLKKRLITRTTNGFFWLLPKEKSQQRNLRELQKFRFFTFNLFSISLRNSFCSKKTCHEFFIQVYRILQYWYPLLTLFHSLPKKRLMCYLPSKLTQAWKLSIILIVFLRHFSSLIFRTVCRSFYCSGFKVFWEFVLHWCM